MRKIYFDCTILCAQNRLTLLFYRQQIEKKRRDRINSSLAELRQLVPAALRKQVRFNNNSIKFKLFPRDCETLHAKAHFDGKNFPSL